MISLSAFFKKFAGGTVIFGNALSRPRELRVVDDTDELSSLALRLDLDVLLFDRSAPPPACRLHSFTCFWICFLFNAILSDPGVVGFGVAEVEPGRMAGPGSVNKICSDQSLRRAIFLRY